MITITLILKLSLLSSSMFFILGPAFIWENSDFLSTYILNNKSGGIGAEFIKMSSPFLSVLFGLALLYAFTITKEILEWSKSKLKK